MVLRRRTKHLESEQVSFSSSLLDEEYTVTAMLSITASLHYISVPSTAGCGGQLSGAQGNFTSPNYPRHYPVNEV